MNTTSISGLTPSLWIHVRQSLSVLFIHGGASSLFPAGSSSTSSPHHLALVSANGASGSLLAPSCLMPKVQTCPLQHWNSSGFLSTAAVEPKQGTNCPGHKALKAK